MNSDRFVFSAHADSNGVIDLLNEGARVRLHTAVILKDYVTVYADTGQTSPCGLELLTFEIIGFRFTDDALGQTVSSAADPYIQRLGEYFWLYQVNGSTVLNINP